MSGVFSSSVQRRQPFVMIVRRLFLLVVLAVGCLSCSSFPGTTSSSPTPAPLALNSLVSSRTLSVGSFTAYIPQEYHDPQTGQLVGFDIDLVNALSARLHLRSRIISTDFSQLVPDLLARRYDVVVSAVAITPELQKQVSFIPYFRGGESLMVKKGNPAAILHLRDLCGHSVAALNGSFEMQEIYEVNTACQAAHSRSVTLRTTSSSMDAVQLLRSGAVQAVYQDSALTDYLVMQYPQSFSSAGSVVNAATEGIIVRKEDTATLNALSVTLAQMKTDGTYRLLIKKWGLQNGDITAVSTPTP